MLMSYEDVNCMQFILHIINLSSTPSHYQFIITFNDSFFILIWCVQSVFKECEVKLLKGNKNKGQAIQWRHSTLSNTTDCSFFLRLQEIVIWVFLLLWMNLQGGWQFHSDVWGVYWRSCWLASWFQLQPWRFVCLHELPCCWWTMDHPSIFYCKLWMIFVLEG